MPLSFIININQKASKIVNKRLFDMEFKRVYIPKDPELYRECSNDDTAYTVAGGKWRPLGVPRPA